ncbi:MAG: family 1 glycosylhydrolase [Clostridia bacterium]|nr:family 1 glycosylhydrolase [Clostridia bacterium]
MVEFKLPDNFLIGTATASVQIEGGDTNNTWYKWCEEGHIKDASSCIIANDHWNRVEQDTEILKSLHVHTHRMSLEWSRIEPSKGSYSKEAIEHYRNEIKLLLKNNIKPLVTLHHFSEPLWFQELGAWKKAGNTKFFLDYVSYVVEELGELVSDWLTFNEPNVFAKLGYIIGMWPPGERNLRVGFRVQVEIIKAHIETYKIIHKIRENKKFPGKTMVGAAIHIRIFDSTTRLGNMVARAADYIFHELFIQGMTEGKILFPLPSGGYKCKPGRYVDFFGINYYTRNIVEFTLNPLNWFHNLIGDNELDKSDLGWDIYPQGVYRVCKKYYDRYKLPIYITENGISDKFDNRRPDYICNHLIYIARAIKEGIPVERYYYWTLMDNFEWTEGETANFGLYDCDFQSQERKKRKSADLFAFICKNRGLTEAFINDYNTQSTAEKNTV